MKDQRKLRYTECLLFGGLLAVLFIVASLIPVPQGGGSEVIREQIYLLPMMSQPMEVAPVQTDLSSENIESTVVTEAILANEEISELLLEAFGIQEGVQTESESQNLTSRSTDALTVRDVDLGSLETMPQESARSGSQRNVLDLRSQASPLSPLASNLSQPEVNTDTRLGDRPRTRYTTTNTYDTPDLEIREEVRPSPITAEVFNEAAFEDSLAAWILNHPADLDPVVLSLMGNDEGAATARSDGQAGQSRYELQMMLAPGNGEVRIVLVEGNDLYYFVRPRIQRQASYFQKGMVRRDETTEIIAVESEDFSPEGSEAQAFYGLFLDWWRTQRK